MDEGATIIDLLKGVKDEYVARDAKSDTKGKTEILDAILEKIVIRGKDAFVVFREPFSYLFDLNRVIQKSNWGETLHRFVNTIWHFDFGFRIDRLAELNQIYLIL